MVRKAAFKGQFYEANEQALEKQIVGCFEGTNGPGALPLSKRSDKQIKAIISPHAGYQFSGPCAAWAYKEIAEAEYSDLYIIIGPNHAGTGSFTTMEGFETPYGVARVDQEFVKSLLEKNSDLTINDEAHANEHSIEVQIPMLQFATKDHMHELKIVPIILSDIDYMKFGLDLKETIFDSGKKVTIIVSSDFTHYGRHYHYVPFTSDVQKNIYEMDQKAINFIEALNVDGFVGYVDEKMCTICGTFPIAVLLKLFGNTKPKVELLHYYTSADLEEEKTYKNSVSYASILFT
ncbi:MAG TPA: AmmeMemoRadiSam system protein B [Alphaproteobacteria bacterium]|nr:AmmeMemoRadiSam system protein B [Alphaproteobacteria bacterium]